MNRPRTLGVAIALAAAVCRPAVAADLSFTPTTVFNDGAVGTVRVIDIDGDGHLDVVTGAPGFGGQVRIHLGDGAGGFTTPAGVTDQMSTRAGNLTIADVDGDGLLDVIGTGSTRRVYIWRRLPGAVLAFQAAPASVSDASLGSEVRQIVVADATGDGVADLVVGGELAVRVWQPGSGTYPVSERATLQSTASIALRVGDIDGDGVPEIVSTSPGSTSGTWTLNIHPTGSGASAARTMDMAGDPVDMVFADADGDGGQDLVLRYAGGTSVPVAVLWNTWSSEPVEGFTSAVDFSGEAVSALTAADVTGDGLADLVAAAPGGLFVAPGSGDLSTPFADPVAFSFTGGLATAVGDLDEDGRPDIAVASSSGVTVIRNTSPAAAAVAVNAAFGDTVVGTHTDRTVTVTNTGFRVLTPGAPAITGTDAARVAVTASGCGRALLVGHSCTVGVRFTPATRGALSAAITFPDAAPAPDTALSLALSGTGKMPGSLEGPAAADVGDVAVGADATRTLTFTNVGDLALTPPAATLTGSPAWSVTADDCAVSVDPGLPCTVTVAVTPGARGVADAVLRVGALDAALHAVGVDPGLLTGPTTADAGEIVVGATARRTLTFTNVGDLPLAPPAAGLTGSPAWSVTADGCMVSLAAGVSCTVTVAVTPAVPGPAHAALHVGGLTTDLRVTGMIAPVTGDRDPVAPPAPAAPVTPPAPTMTAPRFTGAARITFRGILRRGVRLTATAIATGTPAPTLTYRWQRCTGTRCTVIARGRRYTVTSADQGRRLKVTATAAGAAGPAITSSALTGRVTAR